MQSHLNATSIPTVTASPAGIRSSVSAPSHSASEIALCELRVGLLHFSRFQSPRSVTKA